MGFIQAFTGALGGTFADQWKDFIAPRADITPTSLVFGGVHSGTNAGRGENTKGSTAIISNGSKILVPDGVGLILMQDTSVTGVITEPGGYIFNSEDINAKSFFGGDGIIESTLKQSWERFKFGGQPGSNHMAIYVNLKEIPGNRFGTKGQIYWDDAFLGTQVGALCRGTYTLKVVDPLLLVKQFMPVSFVTTGKIFDLSDMDNPSGEQLFNEVVSALSGAFSNYTNDPSKGNRMAKIQGDQLGFAASLSSTVEAAYQWKSGRGLEIERVAFEAIEYDEDTMALLSDVKKADALSGARGNSFMQQAAARGMQSAGENGGGDGMAFMGMGMNAAGAMMGQFNQQQTPAAQNIQQGAQTPQEDPYEKLANLKKLADQGVITEEEFAAAKAKLLGL